jgi:hypothetical protein
MTQSPILFSSPMIRALLDGRKTQMRRIIKPQPFVSGYHEGEIAINAKQSTSPPYDLYWLFSAKAVGRAAVLTQHYTPRHQPGDLLWVRESFNATWLDNGVLYRADGGSAKEAGYEAEPKWKPSIHMPRWASRITLEVTAVKVERLQDISEEDAKAEGVYRVDPTPDEIASGDCTADDFVWMAPGERQGFGPRRNAEQWGPDPVFAYRLVWEAIHGKGSWQANPWVTTISFLPHLRNIDQLIAARAA